MFFYTIPMQGKFLNFIFTKPKYHSYNHHGFSGTNELSSFKQLIKSVSLIS